MVSGYMHTIAIVLQREIVSRRKAIITFKTSRIRFLYSLNVNVSPQIVSFSYLSSENLLAVAISVRVVG